MDSPKGLHLMIIQALQSRLKDSMLYMICIGKAEPEKLLIVAKFEVAVSCQHKNFVG